MANDFEYENPEPYSAYHQYVSPGLAISTQLQNILAQRRMEKRQEMLDELDRRDKESMISYRDENAKSLAEERSATADARRQASQQAYLKTIPAGNVDDVTAAKIREINPSLLQETPGGATLPSKSITGMGMGAPTINGGPLLSSPTVTPSPSQPDPSVPATHMFRGSPDYIQKKQQMDQLTAFANDPSFARLSPEQKLLKIAPLFPNTNPSSILERLYTSKTENPPAPGRVFFADEGTKTLRDSKGQPVDEAQLGPNDKVVNIPRPPAGPQGPEAKLIQYDDAQGKHHVVWVKPGAAFPTDMNPSTLRVGNEPNPGRSQMPILYDKTIATRYATSKDPQARVALAQELINSVPKPMRDDIQYMSDQNRSRSKKLTPDEFIQAGILHAPDGADPEQYFADIKSIWAALGARQ